MRPVSPINGRASPTSVQTQGTPLAIASPMTSGKASVFEVRATRSAAASSSGISFWRPNRWNAGSVTRPFDPVSQRAIRRVQAVADHHELRIRMLVCHDPRRLDEEPVVLEGHEPPGDQDDGRTSIELQLSPDASPDIGVRSEAGQIEAVRDDRHFPGRVTHLDMGNFRRIRDADDRGRDDRREPAAGPDHQAQSPAGRVSIQGAVVDSPGDRDARQPGGEPTDQIGMVEPGLDDRRRAPPGSARQAGRIAQRVGNPGPHGEAVNRDVQRPDPVRDRALLGQAIDDWPEMRLLVMGEDCLPASSRRRRY